MDGSDDRIVVTLNNTIVDYTFVFTLDYSQQMLYWMNSSDNCRYTNYIEGARVDGSGRRIVHNTTASLGSCSYDGYYLSQAIDFFRGAVYSYSGYLFSIFKTVLEHTPQITRMFDRISWYMCYSPHITVYTGMKVISSERQLQGIIPIIAYMS